MNLAEMVAYIRSHADGVIATVHASGAPQAAYLELTATDRGEIVFDAKTASRKIANLRRDTRIAVVVGGADGTTLQAEGVADEPDGEERGRCEAAFVAAFPHFAASLGRDDVVLVRVAPDWARHGDFRPATPIVREVEGLGAGATG